MKYVFLLAFVLAPAYSAYVAAKPAFQAYQMTTCVTDRLPLASTTGLLTRSVAISPLSTLSTRPLAFLATKFYTWR